MARCAGASWLNAVEGGDAFLGNALRGRLLYRSVDSRQSRHVHEAAAAAREGVQVPGVQGVEPLMSAWRETLQEAIFSVGSMQERPGVSRYRHRVARMVTPSRFQHILRVAHLAQAIAVGNSFSESERHATLLAALLHDAARDLPVEELFELAPPRDDLEREHPLSVHGRAGRRLAEKWGVTDERVLSAITGHVFGVRPHERVGMAVYVADVSEPGRGVNDDIRELAICQLERAYRRAVVSKVRYLRSHDKAVHPETLKVYEEIHNA